MTTPTIKPTKQQVRDYMGRLVREHLPPPTPEQVRQELGWNLIPKSRTA